MRGEVEQRGKERLERSHHQNKQEVELDVLPQLSIYKMLEWGWQRGIREALMSL